MPHVAVGRRGETMSLRTIASRLSERGLLGAAHALNVRVRRMFDLPARLHIPDRLLLERQILPQVNAFAAGGRVLLVGCDWYAAHYAKLLPRCHCTSVDPDPARARFGVAGRHHQALLQDLPQFEQDRTFEAIVCNGVYGHGLDEAADCERAFQACHALLRPGGWLVLGWNDVPHRDPVPIGAIGSLARFEPVTMPGLGAQRLLVEGSSDRHTFAFLRRALNGG